MNNNFYILVDGKTKIVGLKEWARWFDNNDNRRIALNELGNGVEVSTVFLGIEPSFETGKPLLFETMVFGGPLDRECDHYATLEQARLGHDRMVEHVREEIKHE